MSLTRSWQANAAHLSTCVQIWRNDRTRAILHKPRTFGRWESYCSYWLQASFRSALSSKQISQGRSAPRSTLTLRMVNNYPMVWRTWFDEYLNHQLRIGSQLPKYWKIHGWRSMQDPPKQNQHQYRKPKHLLKPRKVCNEMKKGKIKNKNDILNFLLF